MGPHPAGGGVITINKGRFGPYLRHGRVMASLPKNAEVETLTMEEAVALLAAKAGKSGKAPARAAKASAEKTAPAKKPAAKKTAAKTAKPAAKKAGPKPAPAKQIGRGTGREKRGQ